MLQSAVAIMRSLFHRKEPKVLNNSQKKQVDAQRSRTIKRLVWQVRWFKNLVFPRFQTLLRKAELYSEMCNRFEMVERERVASELSMGEAYMRLRKDLVDVTQREGAVAAEDEEVERFYESFGRAFDFESLNPRKAKTPADQLADIGLYETDGEQHEA